MSVNKAIIVGHLGKDPEIKYTQNGKAVCNLSVATTEKWKDNSKTEWHRVVVWGKLAEICGQYLSKGKQVYIEGRIETRSWENNGTTKYTTEIIANEMRMLSPRQDSQRPKQQQQQQSYDGYQPPKPEQDEDIPF